MASKQFNSVDGYSVGSVATVVVDANSNISGNAITATANVTSPRFISNVATGTAPLVVTSTTQVANLNVAQAGVADTISVSAGTGNNFIIFANAATGTVSELTSTGLIANLSNNSITATTFVGSLSGAATSATTAGTVTTAAQPNITSTGTLTSLTVSGGANLASSSGNVGIGTTSPGAKLDVLAQDAIRITGFQPFQTWRDSNDSNKGFRIQTAGGATLFSNDSTGGGTYKERMRIDASGNVGIGTSSPGYKLDVNGTGSFVGSSGVGAIRVAGAGGSWFWIDNPTSTTMRFSSGATAGTNPMVLDSSGNVGIGNTAPTHKLSVTGTTSLVGNVTLQSNIAYVSPNGANTINSQMLNGGTLAWSGNAGQLFSIADSMTGNIFTVNDVSGIPMISVDAGGNIQFAVSGGFVNYGVTTGISAAGSTQGTATALTRPINVVSTVSASQGVILPTVPAGARVIIMNTSAAALNVYPPSGDYINSGALNAAYVQPAGVRLEFISVSATQWYTMNATYG